MQKLLAESFKETADLITAFYENPKNLEKIVLLSEKFANTFRSGGKIIICGNGGSACDAMHFAEEFTGRYRGNRPALPVIHLGDIGHITCVGNDFGYEEVFSRGVEAHGKPNDWLIVLSTSGNSKNIIQAVKKAKEKGLHTFSLLGYQGGMLKNSCDEEIIIPGKTADRIQEVTMAILHVLIEGVERILFPENYSQFAVHGDSLALNSND